MDWARSIATRVCATLTTAVVAIAAVAAPPAAPARTPATKAAKGLFPEAPVGNYDGPVKTVFTASNAPKTPALEDLELTDTVRQYGITWTFDRKVRAGRFITGDWYFVGPATVVQITPKPLFGQEVADSPDWKLINDSSVKEDRYKDQWARNGSVLNQRVDTGLGGFDSRLSDGHYDPKQFRKRRFP